MIGAMEMPPDFKYREVVLKGKPRHDRYDRFSIRHPAMPAGRRAKLFAPFAALRGFDAAIWSKDVRYEEKVELSREDLSELDRRLEILHNLTYTSRMARLNHVMVSVTYFILCPDTQHEAFGVQGQYQTVTGICWKVDPEVTRTVCVGENKIAFEDILRIESSAPVFQVPMYTDIYAE